MTTYRAVCSSDPLGHEIKVDWWSRGEPFAFGLFGNYRITHCPTCASPVKIEEDTLMSKFKLKKRKPVLVKRMIADTMKNAINMMFGIHPKERSTMQLTDRGEK